MTNSELETRNSELETRNSELETRNSELETRNSELQLIPQQKMAFIGFYYKYLVTNIFIRKFVFYSI
jgi:hypothetical protein